jgi:hypothetical protein
MQSCEFLLGPVPERLGLGRCGETTCRGSLVYGLLRPIVSSISDPVSRNPNFARKKPSYSDVTTFRIGGTAVVSVIASRFWQTRMSYLTNPLFWDRKLRLAALTLVSYLALC